MRFFDEKRVSAGFFDYVAKKEGVIDLEEAFSEWLNVSKFPYGVHAAQRVFDYVAHRLYAAKTAAMTDVFNSEAAEVIQYAVDNFKSLTSRELFQSVIELVKKVILMDFLKYYAWGYSGKQVEARPVDVSSLYKMVMGTFQADTRVGRYVNSIKGLCVIEIPNALRSQYGNHSKIGEYLKLANGYDYASVISSFPSIIDEGYFASVLAEGANSGYFSIGDLIQQGGGMTSGQQQQAAGGASEQTPPLQ